MAYSACLVPPGSKNMANDHEGSPGTWETLPSPSKCRPETRLTNSQVDPRPRVLGRRGRTRDATMVSPSEGNEVRRKGRQGVAAPQSTVEPGEPSRGTPGREGGAVSGTVGGKHDRYTETCHRVHETTTDRGTRQERP